MHCFNIHQVLLACGWYLLSSGIKMFTVTFILAFGNTSYVAPSTTKVAKLHTVSTPAPTFKPLATSFAAALSVLNVHWRGWACWFLLFCCIFVSVSLCRCLLLAESTDYALLPSNSFCTGAWASFFRVLGHRHSSCKMRLCNNWHPFLFWSGG